MFMRIAFVQPHTLRRLENTRSITRGRKGARDTDLMVQASQVHGVKVESRHGRLQIGLGVHGAQDYKPPPQPRKDRVLPAQSTHGHFSGSERL